MCEENWWACGLCRIVQDSSEYSWGKLNLNCQETLSKEITILCFKVKEWGAVGLDLYINCVGGSFMIYPLHSKPNT
jgi:hypothetical protein